MKKILLLFTIALSLGIFVSCKSNAPSAGAGKTTDMKPEAGSEALPGNAQSASDGVAAPDGNLAEPGALKIVYNEYRGIDLGDGYYELCANGDGTGNILYTDLATMQEDLFIPGPGIRSSFGGRSQLYCGYLWRSVHFCRRKLSFYPKEWQ